MASLITVRLDRGGAPNLGFRLQGGKDFGTPLVVQKVNGGSPAERAGLIAGDSVIKINNIDVFNLRHKDAQDVIVRSGPSFEVTVQRGGSTWKPSVIPTGSFPSSSASIQNVSPVTKTSLAHTKRENIGAIGTGHNVSAKPFAPQVNGTNGNLKLVNNQYNSPLKLYSEESIAETLSAQTEVLPTGALGVNFKKNEKNYDSTNSAVYRMLQEAENEPKSPEPEPDSGVITSPIGIAGLRHVSAPENKVKPPTTQLPPGQNICSDCERLIVGVFVRIKDKNLHVECFKCSTCGTSLKNVGYYNINNKLYCDVHAKLAARNNPPSPNLVPVTQLPGAKSPASHISSALSSNYYPSPVSPKYNNKAAPYQGVGSYSNPRPFSSVNSSSNYNTFPRVAPHSPIEHSYSPTSSAGRYSTVKPVSSVFKGQSVHNIVWPPPSQEEPDLPTACPLYFPPPSQVRVRQKSTSTVESKEESLEELREFFPPPPQFKENYLVKTDRLDFTSPPQVEEKSHFSSLSQVGIKETKSHLTETKDVKERFREETRFSPCQIKVEKSLEIVPALCQFKVQEEGLSKEELLNACKFEVEKKVTKDTENKEMAQEQKTCAQGEFSITSHKECVETIAETLETQKLIENVLHTKISPLTQDIDTIIEKKKELEKNCNLLMSSDSCKLNRPADYCPKDVSYASKSKTTEISVSSQETDPFKQIPSKFSVSPLVSALSTAPSQPFNPQPSITMESVPLPEETVPYFPPEHPIIQLEETKKTKKESKCIKNIKFEPGTTETVQFSKKKKDPIDDIFKDLPKPEKTLTMREALTVAADRPFSPRTLETDNETQLESVIETKTTVPPKSTTTEKKSTIQPKNITQFYRGEVKCRTEEKPFQQCYKEEKRSVTEEKQIKQHNVEETKIVEQHKTLKPVVTTEKKEDLGFCPLFKGFSCSFQNKTDHSQFMIEISTTPPIPNADLSHPKVTEIEEDRTITTVKKEKSSNEQKLSSKIEKQAETVVLTKPAVTSLHKADTLPQYQVSLYENAEADIQLLERTKKKQSESKAVTNPIIITQPEPSFKLTAEDRPSSSSTISHSRPITPSMINKPAPTIPYYQASLVAQQHGPISVNLLDPSTPNVSRSPSPCSGKRTPSPFPSGKHASTVRPKSPAVGPPPNPLVPPQPVPTVRDFKVDVAKKNVESFLPQYKSKMDVVEKDRCEERAEAYQASFSSKQCASDQTFVKQNNFGSTEISAKAEFLEEKCKSESKSFQHFGNETVQVQRKKTVTEEFEHTQKKKVFQIKQDGFAIQSHNQKVELQGTNLKAIEADSSSKCSASQKCATCPLNSDSRLITPKPLNKTLAGSSQKPCENKSNPVPNVGLGGRQAGAIGVAPRRGRGVLNAAGFGGARVPLCGQCHSQIRGPFITALGKIWCPEHFTCATPSCRRPLQDIGFVEEHNQLYCEYCFEQYLAPPCSKCAAKIKGDCLKAIGKNFHPECFNCVYCGKLFGNNPFFIEDGSPYCENDWNELFTTKCFSCGFPIEAGDRWVEALSNNYHSQCFNCTMCKKNLEGQSFFAKGGRPFCKIHAH